MRVHTPTAPQERFESAPSPAALPDFCSVRVLFTVVVSAELLAFVLALALPASGSGPWVTLGLLSLFVQWLALSCTAVLCLTRRWLERLAPAAAGIAAWVMIMGVTAALGAIAATVAADVWLEPLLPGHRPEEFLLRALAVSAILGAVVLRYFHAQAQDRRRIEAEARARFHALQARIRPHFMFNALNTIASLTRSRPEVAEEMVEDLAELLRGSLAEDWRPSTLAGEMELARRYLRMESLRLGERLRWEERCHALPDDVRVPALIIQPLVENAVYHGIEPAPAGGTILIEGALRDGRITIAVSNPLPPARMSGREGQRIALENIRERLRLRFDGLASLEATAEADRYRVELIFPGAGGDE